MHQPSQSDYVNLADDKYGACILWANDDFFASKDNLLKPTEAIFLPEEFTDRGKWMDGWESRRRRVPGHDVCIVRLGLPGTIRELLVDTAHFKGNFPKACSFEVASLSDKLSTKDILAAGDAIWSPLVPETPLQGDHKNRIAVDSSLRATHLRFHIYPDGGVARLRVFGEVVAAPHVLGREGADQDIDLVAVEHGGQVIACNDMFFGSRHNLLGPGRAANMGDGWETKRSRKEAPDWVIVQLGVEGSVLEAEIDTAHFKGNFPESAGLFGAQVPAGTAAESLPDDAWKELLPRTKLEAHRRHRYDEELRAIGAVTHVKMFIWPDGGVSRLRLRGTPSMAGRMALGLRYFNSLPQGAKQQVLYASCKSKRFAEEASKKGPFANWNALADALDAVWRGLALDDWEEAFAGHPRIGEKRADDAQASREQALVASASAETLAELAKVNAEYEAKFGRIYLVCATGKSASQLLDLAKRRLQRSAEEELATMVDEQAKITQLRMQKQLFRTIVPQG